jgi:hypothetical protein
MPMPSRSVQPAGQGHLHGGYVAGADAPSAPAACQGCAGQRQCACGWRSLLSLAFEALIRWALPPIRALAGAGLCGGRRQRARILACPASWGEGGHSRAGCPGPTGFSAPGTVAPARGRCAPGGGPCRAPLAAGCRGDAGEERSRAQVPGSGMLVRKAAPGQLRVIRAAGVSLPRRCRARRRQECSDQRRSAAAAYAPGRRTTGTGVLRRRPDARTRTCAARAGAAGHRCRRPPGSRSATVRRASDFPSAPHASGPGTAGPPRS